MLFKLVDKSHTMAKSLFDLPSTPKCLKLGLQESGKHSLGSSTDEKIGVLGRSGLAGRKVGVW
jgi:hypothetical protein